MANEIERTFRKATASGSRALIPFLTAYYPNRDRFRELVDTVCMSGADILEIGFPHSDPIADGPVIQQSSHAAIKSGFTLERGFEEITAIRARHDIPTVIMCYSNLILCRGADYFIDQCIESGVSGLIVPDMIIEESAVLKERCDRAGISFINLVAPTTPPDRAEKISVSGSGFIYMVSTVGTTGRETNRYDHLRGTIEAIKRGSDLPVGIGFGISSPEAAANAAQVCDGVIIGSKILRLSDGDSSDDGYPLVRKFLEDTKQAISGGLT